MLVLPHVESRLFLYIFFLLAAAGLGLFSYDTLSGSDTHAAARQWFQYHRKHMVQRDEAGIPRRTTMYVRFLNSRDCTIVS